MLEVINFLESDAAAVVLLMVAVSVLWYALDRRVNNQVQQLTGQVSQLTERLDHCEERHGKCERQYQELAAAIKDILTNNQDSAMRNVQYALQQREEDH